MGIDMVFTPRSFFSLSSEKCISKRTRKLSGYEGANQGNGILSMGNDMIYTCHPALRQVSDDMEQKDKLLGYFMNYCVAAKT